MGALLGLAGALATSGWWRGMVFGVQPADPVTIVAASIVLTAAAALACYLPVRRATRVDAVALLRSE